MSFGMLPRYNLFLDCEGWKRNCGKKTETEAAVKAARGQATDTLVKNKLDCTAVVIGFYLPSCLRTLASQFDAVLAWLCLHPPLS